MSLVLICEEDSFLWLTGLMRGWHRHSNVPESSTAARLLHADQCWMLPLLMVLLSLLDCGLDFYICYKKNIIALSWILAAAGREGTEEQRHFQEQKAPTP